MVGSSSFDDEAPAAPPPLALGRPDSGKDVVTVSRESDAVAREEEKVKHLEATRAGRAGRESPMRERRLASESSPKDV